MIHFGIVQIPIISIFENHKFPCDQILVPDRTLFWRAIIGVSSVQLDSFTGSSTPYGEQRCFLKCFLNCRFSWVFQLSVSQSVFYRFSQSCVKLKLLWQESLTTRWPAGIHWWYSRLPLLALFSIIVTYSKSTAQITLWQAERRKKRRRGREERFICLSA